MLFGILDDFVLAEIAHPVELARRQYVLVVRADPESRNLVRHLIFLRPRVGNDCKHVAFDVDDQIINKKRILLAQILAQELADSSVASVNSGKDIDILTPEINSNGQMIFRDDAQKKIWNKQILLLISSASTGWSIERFARCLDYYSGKLVGACALFSAIDEIIGIKVDSIFTEEDIPDYHTYAASECPMCKSKQKIDALVNAFGYSKL